MFTPQRKGWPGWTPPPSKTDTLGKGKTVLQPPPRMSLDENGEAGGGFATPGEADVWRRFRDAGLLDQSSIERKERESLADRASKLEAELYDYQYNMGLLLIEKNEWSSQYEDLKQALTEAEENLKREQAAHFIALAESQKREDGCKKALVVEKQCVADLKRALQELHSLHAKSADISFSSDKKLAEAHVLLANVDEKSLEADAKTHSAEATFTEANRKCLEAERKLQEFEVRESTLKSERASLKAEREVHEEVFSRERKNLQAWERKMQEGQTSLVEGQRLLNERVESANKKDMSLKRKEKEIEELRKRIEMDLTTLKDKEVDMSLRSNALAGQEEEANSKRRDLEAKEKELNDLEERLNIRDSKGIQKIADEHKSILEIRNQKFEAELEQTKELFKEDLKAKEVAFAERVAEVNRKEENVMKREQLLENVEEKFREKQKDLDTKLEALNEMENSLKKKEDDVASEKDLISREKELIQKARLEVEKLQVAVEAEKLRTFETKEKLKVTEKERQDFQRQQAELKQVIEDSLLEKQVLLEQSEALKKEREVFEKEWLVLDERGDHLRKEQEHVNEEKERLEKWVADERSCMDHENQNTMADIQREKEAVRLMKETFERMMKHERSELHEKSHRALEDEQRDLELQMSEHKRRMDFELELRETKLHEEMKDFLDNKERTLRDITVQKDLVQKQMEELHQGTHKLQKEMEELSFRREEIEIQRLEIQKDTDQLIVLSKKLQGQREAFAKEREVFFDHLEHLKHSVGEDVIAQELARSELQIQIDDGGASFLPNLDEYMKQTENLESLTKMEAQSFPVELGHESNTQTHMSWLRKCAARLVNFSPSKRIEVSPENLSRNSSPQHESQMRTSARTGDMAALSLCDHNYRDKTVQALTDSVTDMDNSQSLVSSDSKHQPGRKGKTRGINRNRSVKTTIEEAKAYLGEASAVDVNTSSFLDCKASITYSQDYSFDRDGATSLGQTLLSFAASDADDHEIQSSNGRGRGRGRGRAGVSGGVKDKGTKRKPTPMVDVEAPSSKRYNLRHSTIASKDISKVPTPRKVRRAEKKHNPADVLHNLVENVDSVQGGVADILDSTQKDVFSHRHFQALSAEAAQGGLQTCESGNSFQHMEQSVVKVHPFTQVETNCGTKENLNFGTAPLEELTYIKQEKQGEDVEGGQECTEAEVGSEDVFEDEDNNGGDDEHNGSMGKKLWNFLTT